MTAEIKESALNTTSLRIAAVITLLFLAFHAFVLANSNPQVNIKGDANGYYDLALGIAEYGRLTSFSNPESGVVARPPLYPMFVSLAISAGDGKSPLPVIILQAVVLLATAFMAWRVAEHWLPGYGILVFFLVLFNPSAAGKVHMLLTETLYAFLLTTAIWSLSRYAGRPTVLAVLILGIAVGLATLTKPEARLLSYILPFAVVLVGVSSGTSFSWQKHCLWGLASLLLALAVSYSWSAYDELRRDGKVISKSGKSASHIRYNLAILEHMKNPIGSIQDADDRLYDQGLAHLVKIRESRKIDLADEGSVLTSYYFDRMKTHHPKTIARAVVKGWISFFASGGGQTINDVLGMKIERQNKFVFSSNPIKVLSESLANNAFWPTFVTIIGIGFAVITRTLGLIGLVTLIMRKQWPLLAILIGIVAFTLFVTLFNGMSRYRIPVDPPLMILATYGIYTLHRLFRYYRRGRQAESGRST